MITQWRDRLIQPGTDWNREINDSLDRASIILLLLSEYFLASDYIDGIEMKRAFERASDDAVRVIPVILRECLWGDDPRLSALEALPRNRRPVAGWRDRAKALAEVAAGIKAVAQDLVPQAPHGYATSYPLSDDEGPRIDALPPIWNVPQRKDPAFVDREAELAALAKYLADERPGGAIVAVSGVAGIGKSSFVSEFAYRHSGEYDAVWWARAEHSSTLASDLPALAWALHQPTVGPDPNELWDALAPWLANTSRYLLVFDDTADPEACLDRLPPVIGGHVILTTRIEPEISRPAFHLVLPPFTTATSLEYLREHLGDIEPGVAEVVARRLGGVPLILTTATSYLRQHAESVDEFVGGLNPAIPGEAEGDSAGAVEFVLNRVQTTNPRAAELLRLVSFFAPEDIPLADLSTAAASLDDPFATELRDPAVIDDLVETLTDLDFAWRSGDALSLHRHIQGVVRADLTDEEMTRWSRAAVVLIDAAFPADSGDPQTWRACARLLPHAMTSAEYAEHLGEAPLETGRLLRRVAVYLIGRVQDADAKSAASRALAIHEAHLGETNEEVAADLVTLGRVYQAMDDLKAAREPFERAVAINERLGRTDLRVAHDLIYLGRFLRRIRDLPAAEKVLTRAIRLTERAKGKDDPDVAWALGQLGRVLQDLGQLKKAERALSRALAINEVALGPNDPDIATDLVNLSRVQRELKQLDAAEASLARALRIAKREYSPNHYEVGIVEANIGRVMEDRGDLRSADRHLRRAIEIFRSSVGEEHSFTTTTRDWLEAVRRERAAAGAP